MSALPKVASLIQLRHRLQQDFQRPMALALPQQDCQRALLRG